MFTILCLATFALGDVPGIKGEFGQAEVTQLKNVPAVTVQVGRKTMLLFGLSFDSKGEAEVVKKWLNDNYRREKAASMLSYKIIVEASKPSAHVVTPRGGSSIPIDHLMAGPGTMAKGILYDQEGRNLNAEIIKKGMARTKEKRFEAEEDEARKAKIGVWAK
jgi:hypothetical protein